MRVQCSIHDIVGVREPLADIISKSPVPSIGSPAVTIGLPFSLWLRISCIILLYEIARISGYNEGWILPSVHKLSKVYLLPREVQMPNQTPVEGEKIVFLDRLYHSYLVI